MSPAPSFVVNHPDSISQSEAMKLFAKKLLLKTGKVSLSVLKEKN